ncbi:hypothetical protein [Pseudonocardia spinosispora]|uniref:hypothetical protein n=1 Tax=Pseudonocardia spinosispora TaxID=103441 RepID=UPI0003FA2276|nr:hypothetical protein [Pseudonocardia spinosispora]
MTRSDPPADQTAEVRNLAGQVAELQQQMRQLAQHLITNNPEKAPAQELVSWLTITDPDEATTVLEQLRVWLEQVYLRYPKAELPDCWAWHPDVVEELWWLRNTWCEAYSGDEPSWQKVGDWHERYRPGALARITTATGTCGLDVHARTPTETTDRALHRRLPRGRDRLDLTAPRQLATRPHRRPTPRSTPAVRRPIPPTLTSHP